LGRSLSDFAWFIRENYFFHLNNIHLVIAQAFVSTHWQIPLSISHYPKAGHNLGQTNTVSEIQFRNFARRFFTTPETVQFIKTRHLDSKSNNEDDVDG